MQTLWNVVRTAAFLLIMWSVWLVAVPLAISIVEVRIGIQRFPPQWWLAGPLLLLSTLLAVWAALTLALAGGGTPANFAPTRTLVTTGPYAFVRHPFAIGLTGQIAALGIALGSIPVIVYAAAGFVVWYYVVRPREERALDSRFGDPARAWRRRVRGFRPTLHRRKRS